MARRLLLLPEAAREAITESGWEFQVSTTSAASWLPWKVWRVTMIWPEFRPPLDCPALALESMSPVTTGV